MPQGTATARQMKDPEIDPAGKVSASQKKPQAVSPEGPPLVVVGGALREGGFQAPHLNLA